MDPKSKRGAATARLQVAAVTLPADRPTFTIVHGVDAGRVMSLEGDVAVLGRDPTAQMYVEDGAISRTHCRFRRTDERFFVEDLESANGTFVSGQKLRPMQLAELFSGDRIQVGANLVLRFALSDRFEEMLQQRLYESATRDALTGAFTRSYLLERFDIELAAARRHGHALSFLCIAVSGVDVAGGPAQGGRLLQQVAARVMRTLRIEDVLGRLGFTRFGIVVRNSDQAAALQLAERIRARVAELAVPIADGAMKATLSIGIATLEDLAANESTTALLARGESRAETAVREGGDRVIAHD